MTKQAKGFGAQDVDYTIIEKLSAIYKPSTIKELSKTSFAKLKPTVKNWYGKKTKFVTIMGAVGDEDIPESKIKVITDHYTSDVRRMLNDCILSDPLLSSATDRRFDSIFKDGFHLEFETATIFDPLQNRHLTAEESEQRFAALQAKFDGYLLQLETWKDTIHLIDAMRDSASVSFSQGRAASLIIPGLTELQQGQLPFAVEIMHYSDLGNPVVDIGLTKKIMGVLSKFEDKKLCRADEIVYITRNKRGYRKDGKFLGTSPLEPILTISKSIKRIYNYDIPEAVVAAYITKILFSFDESVDNTDANTFITNFLKTGKLAFGMKGVTSVQPIQPKVDVQMITQLESKLSDMELAVVGTPKSMLNRENGLNRDIATVEAIQFMEFVRKPDEQLLADNFETQLLNPLLSILSGIPLIQLPKRIKIVRNEPERDLDRIFLLQDNLAAKKTEEIQGGELAQDDATSMFGAAGEEHVQFKTSKDEKTCQICRPLDGKVWPKDSKNIRVPIIDTHENCRCSLVPFSKN